MTYDLNLTSLLQTQLIYQDGYLRHYTIFLLTSRKQTMERILLSRSLQNFGNLFSCLVAVGMGLPFQKVIASNNLNDTFTKFIESNIYKPKKSVKTISSAMDVGDPSNFIRVVEFFLMIIIGLKS